MKTAELRLGNLLDYQGVTVHVMVIYDDFASFGSFKDSVGFDRVLNNPESPKPIPLSPEWLERLGFVKKFEGRFLIGCQDFTYHLTHRGLNGFKDGGYFMGIRFDDYDPDPNTVYNFEASKDNIQYVHQLQNLYFALTGEELIAP